MSYRPGTCPRSQSYAESHWEVGRGLYLLGALVDKWGKVVTVLTSFSVGFIMALRVTGVTYTFLTLIWKAECPEMPVFCFQTHTLSFSR